MSAEFHHPQHHHGNWIELEHFFQIYHSIFKESKLSFIKEKVKIQRGWNILEIGCGSCYNFDLWINAVGDEGSLTLLEPDKSFGGILETKCKDFKNVKYIREYVENANPCCTFTESGFDLIVLDNVYHHLHDVEGFFSFVKKSINTAGGKLLVFDAMFGTSRFITSVRNEYMDLHEKAARHSFTSQTANAPKLIGWHVLEIGCGSCYNFDVWLNAVGEEGSLTLVEPDEGFGKYLEEKSKHHKNVKYIAKSLEESEPLCCFSKTGYNLVVLDNVYHHLSDVDKCLNPVGGKLLMFEAVFGTSRFITPVKNQYMEIQGKAIKHGYASQTANAPKQLELHGFQVVYNELIVKSTSDKESPLAILYRDGMHAMILSKDLEEKKRLQLWKEIWDNPQTVLFGDYTMYLLASIK